MNSVHVTVRLCCTSYDSSRGVPCGIACEYAVTDTGVDPLARARGAGWTFYRGAARCPKCGRAAAGFGPATYTPPGDAT